MAEFITPASTPAQDARTCPCCPHVSSPTGFPIADPTHFSEQIHLDLREPTSVFSLTKDLGNDEHFVSQQLPSDIACTSPFSVLSPAGIEALSHSIELLEPLAMSCARIPRMLRGGTFRSNFMNELAHSPAILGLVSRLAGCELIPHPMRIHHLHLNFNPLPKQEEQDRKGQCQGLDEPKPHSQAVTEAESERKAGDKLDTRCGQGKTMKKERVDKWHCDTTPFVLVLFCTSPEQYEGGNLQYFHGTEKQGVDYFQRERQWAARCTDDAHHLGYQEGQTEEEVDEELRLGRARIRNIDGQQQGWGVLMQGSRVFHQVTPITRGLHRTTAVFSFQPRNVLGLEACDRLHRTYNRVDPLHVFIPDWARYRAWKLARRIETWQEKVGLASRETAAPNTAVSALPPAVDAGQQHELSTDAETFLCVAERTRLRLHLISLSLPYVLDRERMISALESAASELLLWFKDKGVPPHEAQSLSGEDRSSTLATATAASAIDGAVSNVPWLRGCPPRYGWNNFRCILSEFAYLLEDIRTVGTDQKDRMEYF